jgi:uncharacterized peroxidase-related enzyme
MQYQVHSRDTAPNAAKQTIDQFVAAWGFLPNLGAVMAESPAALEMLWQGYGALTSKGTFSAAEQNVIAIAVSREGGCEYCVAAHSTLAAGAGLDPEALDAVRDGAELQDPKLEALRATAGRLAQKRGWLDPDEKERFFRAGYTKGQLFELIGWASLKTLTNYVNHVAGTPLDKAWEGQRWTADAVSA